MRILFYSSIFPRTSHPNRGIYCLSLCRALARLGHDVRVISPRPWLEKRSPKRSVPSVWSPELETFQVEYPTYYYPPGLMRGSYDSFMWASTRGALRRVVREFSPDYLISYWIHPDGAVAVRAGREANVPSAVIVGGSDLLILGRKPGRRQRKIVQVLSDANAVFVVGSHLRERAIELGVPAQKVHVNFQGTDTDLFHPGDRSAARQRLGIDPAGHMLLFVGNLLPIKAVDVLLNACAKLRDAHVDYKLCLIGEGTEQQALERQAAELGLSGLVRFVGPVLQRDLPDWYRSANLTVLSSHSEGIPNVLRESLACGTPFVATHVGGVYEIARVGVDRLVPPNDADALARAMQASLEQPTTAANTNSRLWSWTESANDLLAALPHVVRPDITRQENPHPSTGAPYPKRSLERVLR